MAKNSGSGSGMNNPDLISDCLEIIFFWVKILKFFFVADPIRNGKNADPGSGILDGKNWDPGSGINFPDPQHWSVDNLCISLCPTLTE
jgi:hypothetical protein